MLKKTLVTFLALLSLAVVLLSFLKVPTLSISFNAFSKREINSISGAPGADGPVMAVKIDDTQAARPQAGLESADLVYIEQVEGGLTRLAALYSSRIPEVVGPVRSARISDIELLSQYGKVAFAYSGAQKKMWPVIAAANLFDVGATKYGPTFYSNDPSRVAPTAMMLKTRDLMTHIASNGIAPAQSKNMGWNFSKDADSESKPVLAAHFSWPASSYDITWTNSRFELSHLGTPDIAANGERLYADTFVAQIVSITDSIYHDKVGGVTPFSATVGSGKAYVFRDGGYVIANWHRTSEDSGTTFTLDSGKEVTFKAGRIWIGLMSKEPVLTTPKAS